jgi:hypothetical protein
MIIFKILTGHCALVSGTGETGFAGSNIRVSIIHPSEVGLSENFSSLPVYHKCTSIKTQ